MDAIDYLYAERKEVITEMMRAKANLTDCEILGHEGMGEIWTFRIKGLTEQLHEIEEKITLEEGK